jgi:DNA-binding XRE family transcriptional regulator
MTETEPTPEEKKRNNVKKLREERLLSKAELARKAGLSALTIDRVESGMPCRMDTKRKIILALGMTIEEKDKVFEKGQEDGEG